jgi:hypothetical protein
MLAIDDDTIQTGQGDDLRVSNGWDGDEGQQRLLLASELVQKP